MTRFRLPLLRRVLVVSALVVPVLCVSGCVRDVNQRGYIQHDRQQFAVRDDVHVRLFTFEGPVEVRGWDRSMVEVNIEKRAATREQVERIDVTSAFEGDEVRVEAKPPTGTWKTNVWLGQGMSVKLVAYVPTSSQVQVESGDGALMADRLHGQVELRTLDGRVTSVDMWGSLRVWTGDGSVRLHGVRGAVEATTLDGAITLTGRPDRLSLSTSDGAVVVHIDEDTKMAGDWEIRTFDGAVELHLPTAFDAELDAMTDDGSVSSALPSTPTRAGRPQRQLKGRLGRGGHTIRIRSGDGRITVRPS